MDNTEDGIDHLFDVGSPVAVVLCPELPPEKQPVAEPDRTALMEFQPPLAGATISPCGKYRYVLWRKFKNIGKKICWICLNPSVADSVVDDPSLTRMMSFSKREGAAEIFVLNLFAFRATDPRDLRAAAKNKFDVTGPENLNYVAQILGDSDFCIAGWGNGGSLMRAGRRMMESIDAINANFSALDRVPILCLGVTKHGHPLHPLYVAANKPLTAFQYGGINDDDGFEL